MQDTGRRSSAPQNPQAASLSPLASCHKHSPSLTGQQSMCQAAQPSLRLNVAPFPAAGSLRVRRLQSQTAATRQTLGRKASEAATSVQPVKTLESSEHTGARTMVARFQEGFQFSNFEPAQRLLHTAARPPASHKKEKQKKPGCGISMMRQRLFAPGGDAAADIPLVV